MKREKDSCLLVICGFHSVTMTSNWQVWQVTMSSQLSKLNINLILNAVQLGALDFL